MTTWPLHPTELNGPKICPITLNVHWLKAENTDIVSILTETFQSCSWKLITVSLYLYQLGFKCLVLVDTGVQNILYFPLAFTIMFVWKMISNPLYFLTHRHELFIEGNVFFSSELFPTLLYLHQLGLQCFVLAELTKAVSDHDTTPPSLDLHLNEEWVVYVNGNRKNVIVIILVIVVIVVIVGRTYRPLLSPRLQLESFPSSLLLRFHLFVIFNIFQQKF